MSAPLPVSSLGFVVSASGSIFFNKYAPISWGAQDARVCGDLSIEGCYEKWGCDSPSGDEVDVTLNSGGSDICSVGHTPQTLEPDDFEEVTEDAIFPFEYDLNNAIVFSMDYRRLYYVCISNIPVSSYDLYIRAQLFSKIGEKILELKLSNLSITTLGFIVPLYLADPNDTLLVQIFLSYSVSGSSVPKVIWKLFKTKNNISPLEGTQTLTLNTLLGKTVYNRMQATQEIAYVSISSPSQLCGW